VPAIHQFHCPLDKNVNVHAPKVRMFITVYKSSKLTDAISINSDKDKIKFQQLHVIEISLAMITTTIYDINEFHRNYAELKKPDTKDDVQYNSKIQSSNNCQN
jgi:hypothetical protein